MSRREIAVVAFALAVASLAIVIVVGHVSIQVAPGGRLPALNGAPSPTPRPGGVGIPQPSPSPSVSSRPIQAERSRLSSTGGPTGGARCRASASNSDSSTPRSGSTAENLPPVGLRLPIATPSPAPLPVPTP